MTTGDRYDTDGSPEGEFEPGSNDAVLRNKLGVVDPVEMELIEFDLLSELQDQLLLEIESDQGITVRDLKIWHRRWLGQVYPWAGQFRNVNVSKDDFPFAAAGRIQPLMEKYEQEQLERLTPCNALHGNQDLAAVLAECHVELVLIHPFREGNGRIARLLATVMALQAGEPPLDFSVMEADQPAYIGSIHAGHSGDLGPMTRIFLTVLEQSR